jgi:hypothetical protein
MQRLSAIIAVTPKGRIINLVDFAWHIQVSFDLFIYFKTEELVYSGLCTMHLGHNSIFTSSRIKIHIPTYLHSFL